MIKPLGQLLLFFGLSVFSLGADLDEILDGLESHIEGRKEAAPSQLLSWHDELPVASERFGEDLDAMTRAFRVIDLFDEKYEPLFFADENKLKKRSESEGAELERAMFTLQQGLLDHAYVPKNVAQKPELFAYKFATADYFPGKCEPTQTPDKTLSVEINATQVLGYGYPQSPGEEICRRPLGWYLPAGEVAVLAFPRELINKGYNIRVGAHSWDLRKRPKVLRLDRVSLLYPVDAAKVTIVHPLGGNIYLEVPWKSADGIVTVHARNVVDAPNFVKLPFKNTDKEQWRKDLQVSDVPWIDFETQQTMMQIPRAWALEMKDPDETMAQYDNCMTLYSKFSGRQVVRPRKTLYQQVDVILRGYAFFPGYPQSNFNWNPKNGAIKNSQRWVIEGPHKADSVLFHEMGHAERLTKFPGGVEALVNVPYIYIQNAGYGVDLDLAYGRSSGGRDEITIDQGAIGRMITENFRAGRPANTTNVAGDEVKYQHRGYGIYADYALLFGWEPMEAFWKKDQENYISGFDGDFSEGKSYPASTNRDPVDSRILRLSIAAGADITALAKFWGRYPEDEEALQQAMLKHGLKPSAAIKQRLIHYKSLIPMDQQRFKKHALIMYPKCERIGRSPNERNPKFGHGWYHEWLKKYSNEDGIRAQQALDKLIASIEL